MLQTVNIKPRKLYVIIFIAAFCMGFLVRHFVAVREKNNELAERAENRKYMEQLVKEQRELLKRSIDNVK